jgi:peroxiredoxin
MTRTFWAAGLLAAASATGQELKPGAKAPDFTVRDLKGAAVSASALRGDLTAIVFVSTKCPISNGYNERMNALARDYAGRVRFVFVNSNANETAEDVEAHVRSHNLEFTPYKDPDNQVADRFGATVTPEVFLIGKDGTLLYRGAIDDSVNTARVQNNSLRKALDATLPGAAPPQSETKAFGCTIKRKKKVT